MTPQARLQEIRERLAQIEWAGEPHRGTSCRRCPVCQGVAGADRSQWGLGDTAIGHRANCWLHLELIRDE